MSYQIAFVKTNQEITFRDFLERHEIEAYVPISRIETRIRHKRKPLVLNRAILPHYVWVKDAVSEIVRLHGGFIRWLMSADDEVYEAPESEVEMLREREATGEFDKISKAPGIIFCPGVRVRVLVGPMSGFDGVVRRGPKRQAIAKVEINGRLIDCPLAILAIVT